MKLILVAAALALCAFAGLAIDDAETRDLEDEFKRKEWVEGVPKLKSRLKGFSDLESDIDSPEATEVKRFLSTLKPDEYKSTIGSVRDNLHSSWTVDRTARVGIELTEGL